MLKTERFCEHAALRGLKDAWMDTYYIDKKSSAELSEANNSISPYYQRSTICFVFLSDVDGNETGTHELAVSFEASRWFARGWTLQELLAPDEIVFYDQNWTSIGGLHVKTFSSDNMCAKINSAPVP